MRNKHKIILMVDDDEDDLLIIGQAIKALGPENEIHLVFNGQEAITKLEEMKMIGHLPCLVVLDINMPKMDGKQTLVAIQGDEQLREIPIVILTTSSSAVDKMYFKLKQVEMITKPTERKVFYEVAKRLLEYCCS